MAPTRSVGQANFFPKSTQVDRTSIIGSLTSRTLTGQSLNISIHQHIGYKLHLLWQNTTSPHDLRCIESKFCMYDSLQDLCNELKNGALEGLCNCVSDYFLEEINDKVKRCDMGPCRRSQKNISPPPRHWVRTLQDIDTKNRWWSPCRCPKAPVSPFCDF